MSKLRELHIEQIQHDLMEDADYQYAEWLIAIQANDVSRKQAIHVSRISRAMDREEAIQQQEEQLLDQEIPNWQAAAY